MRCSDDELDALSLWFKQHTRPSGRCMIAPSVVESEDRLWENKKCTLEDNMRFEIKEIKGEYINTIYPDVWTIKDNYDENSPVDKYRANKKSAEELCEWLNENVEELSFHDKVNLVIEKLWDDDEIVVDDYTWSFVITEIKPTEVTVEDIYELLKEVTVDYYMITKDKAVYKINKE